MRELLLLRAEDADDLRLVSACVQDMAVKAADVAWSRRARRLVIMGNRFRHEADDPKNPAAATRILSALRFDFLTGCKRRNWPADPQVVLTLLAITGQDGAILLSFGGGAALRLEAEAIDVTLEDLSGPWGARHIPDHESA